MIKTLLIPLVFFLGMNMVNAMINEYDLGPTEPIFKYQGEPYLLIDYIKDISFIFFWIAIAIIFLVSILIERENKKFILSKTAKFILIIGFILGILSVTGLVYLYVMSA